MLLWQASPVICIPVGTGRECVSKSLMRRMHLPQEEGEDGQVFLKILNSSLTDFYWKYRPLSLECQLWSQTNFQVSVWLASWQGMLLVSHDRERLGHTGPQWPSSPDYRGSAERKKSPSVLFCSLFKWSFWHYKVAFCTHYQIPTSSDRKQVLGREAGCTTFYTDIAPFIPGPSSSSPYSHCKCTTPLTSRTIALHDRGRHFSHYILHEWHHWGCGVVSLSCISG